MKIVFCGGHHNSALVVAERLKETGAEIFWFGHKFSMIGDKNPSAEYLEVTKKGIPFIEIKAGKLQPKYRFWQNLLRIPIGFFQSLKALLKIKPDLIFSSGGFLALPVAYCGFILGIPVVTHEQTTVVGSANKLISLVAKKVFITFTSSAEFFPSKKIVLTGLPIREEIFTAGKKLFNNGQKTIYFTGGKQGAHVINEAVFKILPDLLPKFNVIHQCGSTSLFNDLSKAREFFGKEKNYLAKDYFFAEEIGNVYHSADLVISRAGAHTVYELLALRKPAILIPIPWSNQNEQEKNAQMLKSSGLAEILSEEELKNDLLLETINKFEHNFKNYHLTLKESAVNLNATEKIISEIKKII